MKPEKLRDLLRDTLRDNQRASEAEVRAICWEACKSNPELIAALFEYWFGNSYRDFTVIAGSQQSTAVISIDRKRSTSNREIVAKVKDQLKAALMDYALSDGTLLRFATFAQCARDGNWLAAVAKAGKPTEVVGKKLTEADLQNLLRRFRAKRRKVA